MALTDTAVRKAKPADKPYKLADERGLYMLMKTNGSRYWRFDYRFESRRKTLALGVYPDVGLKAARDRRDQARKLLADGVDPGANRRAAKEARTERASNSLETVAREWYSKYSPTWASSHSGRLLRRLEIHVFPWVGGRPIAEIEAPELLRVLRRMEEGGALETAHRVLRVCGQIFMYAVATSRCKRNPCGDLRKSLPPAQGTHFSATLDRKRLAQILRAMRGYEGTFIVRCALYLAPLVFVRPVELRTAKWEGVHLDTAEWHYTVTKTKTPHIVPLSTQSVEILRELHPLTGHEKYVFPGGRSPGRPMSESTLLGALRCLGVDKTEMTIHGFRAVARTLLDEVLGYRPDFIEHQLAHAVRDPNGRAYNRTTHLEGRREMMQAWADYLDKMVS